MQYRKLGNRTLEVSRISVGADVPAHTMDRRERETLLETFRHGADQGVNLFDTAEGYGNGLSEELLGEAVAPFREKIYIASKVSMDHLAYGDVIAACENSLRRLKTDYLDLYYIHIPNDSIPLEETMEAFARLKSQGKIHGVGVSNFSRAQLERAGKVVGIDVLQCGYNPLWRKPEKELIPYCLENGISIIPYSPLAHGLLTGMFGPDLDLSTLEGHRRRVLLFQPEWYPLCSGVVEQLRPIAARHGRTVAQVTLHWILARPGITALLSGGQTPAQLDENLAALEFALAPGEIDEITKLSEPLKSTLPDWQSIWFEKL